MRRRATTAALAASLSVTGSALGADAAIITPPTDERIEAVVRQFETKRDALSALSETDPAEYRTLEAQALAQLNIAQLSAHQLAILYQARVFGFPSIGRDAAIARLTALQDETTTSGSAAAVLRLELLGNHFVRVVGGERFSYHPEPEFQRELLGAALNHPALADAAVSGNAAAAMLFGSISGMANVDVWSAFHDELFDLAQLYSGRTPPVLFRDAADYVDVLDQIASVADAEELKEIKTRIVTSGLVVLEQMYGEDAQEDVFIAAEQYLDALGALASTEQKARLGRLRATIAASGRSVLKRIDAEGTHLTADELDWVRGVIARLATAVERGELVGKPAPSLDFVWSHPNRIQSLDDLRGKIVVLDFWTTWCGPCVASFPNIRELQELYVDYPVEIVGVTSVQGSHRGPDGVVDCADDPDREMALMHSYIQQMDMTWTVAFSRQSAYNPEYGIRGIPHVVILDPQGVLRERGLHPADPLPEKAAKINALLEAFGLPAPELPATTGNGPQ